jgi:hypothetical protein
MKSWKTTLAGITAGLAMLSGTDSALPSPWPQLLHVLCAVALAMLGYHATDCARCPGNALRKVAGAAMIILLVVASGCAVSTLGLKLNSPAFGTFQLSIGGGSIGKGQTNLPPETTNAAPVNVGTNTPPY